MTQPVNATAGERLAGFDLLRVAAALAVVVLHATAPYLAHRMPGLRWPVFDVPSPVADAVGWAIELSIMPLFLMIAGLFALPLWRRHGDRAFLQHRAVRLLGPLAFAAVLVLPMDLYVWLLGWVVEGQIEPRKLRSLKFDAGVDDGLWGLSHLWFLHYLFLYCVVAVAAVRVADWAGWTELPRRMTALLGMLAGFVLIGWATLAAVPEVVFGFQHAFLPVPSKWIYCGTYFAGGLLLAVEPRFLEWTRRSALPLTVAGVAATAVGVWLGYGLLEGRGAATLRLLTTGMTVFTAWTLSLGLVGFAARNTSIAEHSWIAGRQLRYAAAASFWVYLIHHPIVGLVHIDLKVYAPTLAPELKVVIATLIAVLFAGLSFEVLIRRPPIARWMGIPKEFIKGPRPRRPLEEQAEPANGQSNHGQSNHGRPNHRLPNQFAKPAA